MNFLNAINKRAVSAVSTAIFCAFISQNSLSQVHLAAPAAPPEVSASMERAQHIGRTRLRVLGFNIYDADLWAAPNFVAAEYPKHRFALRLTYLRNFTGTALAERSLQEMRRLAPVNDEKAEKWLAQMHQTFPNVKPGDQILGQSSPEGWARFSLNGKPLAEVRDAEFALLFFGIWLSPRTSEPQMRSELLGLTKP